MKYLWGVLVLHKGCDGLQSEGVYLFACFLDEGVSMDARSQNESQEIVEGSEIERVGKALGLDYEETLEGVYDFLNLLPLVGALTHLSEIAFNDLVNTLILLDEDQQEVVGSLTHFRLHYTQCTFSSDKRATTCGKS